MHLTAESLAERCGYLKVGEVAALKGLAISLRQWPRAVNVGAGIGTSGLALLEARNDLYLYSIDTEASSPFGSLLMEREALDEAGFRNCVRHVQIHGDSRDVGRSWLGKGFRKVDLVFVDDGHTYEECMGDVLAWRPNLDSGGIMAFHDYRNEFDIGVSRAVDELMAGCERAARVDSLIAFRVPGISRA